MFRRRLSIATSCPSSALVLAAAASRFRRVIVRPRRTFSMSTSTQVSKKVERKVDKASPFTLAVVEAVRKLYPEKLADSSFDNTGLLLEAPHRINDLNNSVLLTIDLTSGVADEAIDRKDSIIIAYHPIIFRPIKALTLVNSQQSSLLRLAQAGISVYCPHTAVDAAPNGLNDWLADIITATTSRTESKDLHTRSFIAPITPPLPGFENAGYGRIVTLSTSTPLSTLLSRISTTLSLPFLSVAIPQSVPSGSKSSHPISTIGICAGSGGSLLNGLDVDLLFTGELSHHEALAAIERGSVVITAFHSNTERAFLRQRMRHVLAAGIEEVIERLVWRGESKGGEGKELVHRDFEINVSKVDRDPFEVVAAGQTEW